MIMMHAGWRRQGLPREQEEKLHEVVDIAGSALVVVVTVKARSIPTVNLKAR